MLDFLNKQDVRAELVDSLNLFLLVDEFYCWDVLNETNQLLDY